MKILLVAMSDSIHVARWIDIISNLDYQVYLFPCQDFGATHPNIKGITIFHTFFSDQRNSRGVNNYYGRRIPGKSSPSRFIAGIARGIQSIFHPTLREIQLKNVIDEVKPDIIHSMELQHAGYLTLNVKKKFFSTFPPWLVTNWGSDIFYFGRFPNHENKIREVLDHCDYYSCECNRDIKLARLYGYKGFSFPPFPNSGGFDLAKISLLRQPGLTSSRRVIMIKGYQHWAGRALVALKALEMCSDLLLGYKIIVYSSNNNKDIKRVLNRLKNESGVSFQILPNGIPHEEILKYHGMARISIGLSVSDGISTSFLEAIAMGSFPIQSNTACVNEWVKNGENGYIVPPEDPTCVTEAIRSALQDDQLVDKAAQINADLVKRKLDKNLITECIKAMYEKIFWDANIKKKV
ncbi:MAG: glycosyltransferase [Methanomicrobiales archaeon]|nr:glycosyltransferase [Methanomicrobiales archaeon]